MYLPYECFEPPRQGADAITRRLHEALPLSVQREIRDKHITGFFDVGAYVLSLVLAMKHPSTLPRFIALSRSGTTYQYGLEAHQVVEVYRCGQEEAPVLVFVHGGAWCSGKPQFYRLIASGLLRCGFDVALVGYTFYKGEPNVGVLEHQVDDLLAALEFLARPDSPACLSTRPVVLSGHSSGAHLCAMLLLREASRPRAGPPLPRVVGFVAFSGVFDIAEHYLYEARRGLHEVSGMKAACGPERVFNRSSPTVLIEQLTPEQAARFPPTLVIHGTEDVTVPYTNSYRFANGLANRGVPVVTAWLSGVDHFGPMQSLMFDPEGATEAQVRRFAETWVRPAVARL